MSARQTTHPAVRSTPAFSTPAFPFHVFRLRFLLSRFQRHLFQLLSQSGEFVSQTDHLPGLRRWTTLWPSARDLLSESPLLATELRPWSLCIHDCYNCRDKKKTKLCLSVLLLQMKSLEPLVKERSAKLLSAGICRGLL